MPFSCYFSSYSKYFVDVNFVIRGNLFSKLFKQSLGDMKNIAYISERYLITVSIIPFIVKSTFSKYENKGLLIGKHCCDSNSFTGIGANQADDSDSFYGGKTSARSEKLNSKN